MLGMVWDSIITGAGLFWRAAWALALGYAISAAIQVFVSRRAAAERLGDGSPAQLGLAALLGFVSSSCSFAALSATRSLWTKGAALTSALAFMFASTNLAIEVAALAFIFLGWQYSLALFAGAPILILVMAVLVRLTRPDQLAARALEQAEQASGMDMDAAEGLPQRFSDRVRDERSYENLGRAYFGEWRMVYKELIAGFLVAGAVAALVPASFFQALFPQGDAWYVLPLQVLLAPVLAVLTVIGSMGNGPLAAILAEHGIMFGAIMAFLYSDFVVPPALKINARYYGWKFAVYLGLIFAAAAVVTGIVIHVLFALLGLIPGGARSVEEMATFSIDYTFWLNLVSVIVVAVMFVLGRRAKSRARAGVGG
ncbi:permease [Nocardioides vastitatis]|uniref:Permease n=2 Tax=Nocardioides vastitatis TaxID=2568655 RepID=A0ABW0ZP49_9ACTN|nr:permease [Nocardioides sp.]